MKKLLGIVVLGFLFISNAKAVPKWLDSKILEVCKAKQDITLNMNWKHTGNEGDKTRNVKL